MAAFYLPVFARLSRSGDPLEALSARCSVFARLPLDPLHPLGHAFADVPDALARVLEDPLEALAIVLERLLCLGAGIHLLVSLPVGAADDPVVVARAHPTHQLRDPPHRGGVG